MLTRDNVKVLDFGLAQMATDAGRMPHSEP